MMIFTLCSHSPHMEETINHIVTTQLHIMPTVWRKLRLCGIDVERCVHIVPDSGNTVKKYATLCNQFGTECPHIPHTVKNVTTQWCSFITVCSYSST